MSIQVQCIQCGARHQVNDRMAGRRVRCPECETAIHVPELEANAEPVEVEAEVVSVEVEAVEAEPVEAVSVEAVAVESEPAETVEMAAVPIPEPAETQAIAVPAVPQATATPSPRTTAPPDEDEDEQFLPRPEREEDELDMTPMVDVTFLLLIFFMVTASFSLQKSIEMPQQQTDAPSTQAIEEDPEELDQVELQIDERGAFLVLAADWEAETPGKQHLISKLREAKVADAAKLIIKVHEEARLQSLVDGMDAGTIAGYSEIQVTQVDQFD